MQENENISSQRISHEHVIRRAPDVYDLLNAEENNKQDRMASRTAFQEYGMGTNSYATSSSFPTTSSVSALDRREMNLVDYKLPC